MKLIALFFISVFSISLSANESLTIKLSKDKIYEYQAYFIKDKKLLKRYLKSEMLIQEKYHAKVVFKLRRSFTNVGLLRPNIIRVVEWNSIDDYQSFLSDPEYLDNYNKRDKALKHFISTMTRTQNNTIFSFSKKLKYEVAGIFIRPDGGHERLQAYGKEAFPIAKSYSGEPIFTLIPFQANWDSYLPHMIMFGKWNSNKSFHRFENDSYWKKELLPLRTSAFSRLEQILTIWR